MKYEIEFTKFGKYLKYRLPKFAIKDVEILPGNLLKICMIESCDGYRNYEIADLCGNQVQRQLDVCNRYFNTYYKTWLDEVKFDLTIDFYQEIPRPLTEKINPRQYKLLNSTKIKKCFIQDLSFSDFDYSSIEGTITMVLKFD